MAIDSAAGRIYWANWDVNTIGFANLDGSGGGLLNTGEAEIEGPAGLAIDPAGGKLYWANEEGTKISYANLDGSGGGNLNTEGATVQGPQGVAFYPATGRVYWANDGAISYANVDGSGGDDVDTTGAELSSPVGVAIDASTNRIFWANFSDDSIGFVNLGGGGGGDFEIGGGGADPEGAAVDPLADRVYFASVSEDFIGYAGLSGGPPSLIDIAPVAAEYPSFPVLLKTPVNTGSPAMTKAPKPVPKTLRAKQGPQVPSHSETLNCSRAPGPETSSSRSSTAPRKTSPIDGCETGARSPGPRRARFRRQKSAPTPARYRYERGRVGGPDDRTAQDLGHIQARQNQGRPEEGDREDPGRHLGSGSRQTLGQRREIGEVEIEIRQHHAAEGQDRRQGKGKGPGEAERERQGQGEGEARLHPDRRKPAQEDEVGHPPPRRLTGSARVGNGP